MFGASGYYEPLWGSTAEPKENAVPTLSPWPSPLPPHPLPPGSSNDNSSKSRSSIFPASPISSYDYSSISRPRLPEARGSLLCESCGQCFRFKKDLKRHVSVMHSPNANAYECACGKTIMRRGNFRRHIRGCTAAKKPLPIEDSDRSRTNRPKAEDKLEGLAPYVEMASQAATGKSDNRTVKAKMERHILSTEREIVSCVELLPQQNSAPRAFEGACPSLSDRDHQTSQEVMETTEAWVTSLNSGGFLGRKQSDQSLGSRAVPSSSPDTPVSDICTGSEGSNATDSDLLSISDSSEETGPRDEGEALSPAESAALHRILSDYEAKKEGQNDHQSGGPSTGFSTTTTGPSTHGSPTSGQGTKRTSKDKESHGGNENPFFIKPAAKKLKSDDGRQQVLACPYWKREPEKHRRCCKMTLRRIRDVKFHLHRYHTPKFYCQRCFVIFNDGGLLEAHLTGEPCTRLPSARLAGLSTIQTRALSKKSNPKLTEEQQWFVIWEIVFPHVEKPSSAYVDFDLSAEMCSFTEHYSNHGHKILMEALDNSGMWSMSPEEREIHSRRVLRNGLNLIYENWVSTRSRAPTTPLQGTLLSSPSEMNGTRSTGSLHSDTPATSIASPGRSGRNQASQCPPTPETTPFVAGYHGNRAASTFNPTDFSTSQQPPTHQDAMQQMLQHVGAAPTMSRPHHDTPDLSAQDYVCQQQFRNQNQEFTMQQIPEQTGPAIAMRQSQHQPGTARPLPQNEMVLSMPQHCFGRDAMSDPPQSLGLQSHEQAEPLTPEIPEHNREPGQLAPLSFEDILISDAIGSGELQLSGESAADAYLDRQRLQEGWAD